MKTARILTLAICLMALTILCPSAANAFERVDLTHPTSLTILANDEDVPMEGVTFYIHHVADMNEEARFELLRAYGAFSGDINALENAAAWRDAADDIRDIARDIAPTASVTTGADGKAVFSGLKPGLYLLTGDPLEIVPWAYSFSPFLISVPTRDAHDNWVYDVVSDIKMDRQPALISLEVVKVWKDDRRYEDKRPQQLEVELLRDGEVVETVYLTKENGWRHVFTDLPAGYEYRVREPKVPKDYKVSYDTLNGAMVIVNTYQVKVTPEPDLPQTGQLNWPIPVLAGLGLILFVSGWAINRKWSQEHEEEP